MESVWGEICSILKGTLSTHNFKTWIDPLQPLRIENNILCLGCPNRFFLAWVRDNYFQQIKAALSRLMEQRVRVETIELAVAPPLIKPGGTVTAIPQQQELPEIDVYRQSPIRFNRRFTFERFVVGVANQFAYSAAQAMATGREINRDSLYLLADPGLGKSHLSQAIGHHLLSRNAQQTVYYLTAEDFTNELVYSLKNHGIEEFKNKYRRGCDVLVLEEIHFLSGKEKVQAELTYTLDCLAEKKKKVVFTSSRLPKDIPRLGRHFVSRLNNCLISTIEPPDYETRLRILERKAIENEMTVTDAVLEFLARHLKKDVRKMESCINNLGAKSKLLKRPINIPLAEETLAELVERTGCFSPDSIMDLVGRHYQVSIDEMRSPSRRKNVVLPRNVGMYLCRQMTDLSLESIGQAFSRNHSTVLYSVNQIESRKRKDAKLKNQISFLTDQLNRQIN